MNGRALPPVTGALGPVVVPVGELLQPGRNRLQVHLEAPAEDTDFLATAGRFSDLQVTPPLHLLLRPEEHLEQAWLPMKGKLVTPMARVHAPPKGAAVRFYALLDGKILQELGEAPVEEGLAVAPAARWGGPLWNPEEGKEDALFHLVAELVAADGELLDQGAWRTASRSPLPGSPTPTNWASPSPSSPAVMASSGLRGRAPSASSSSEATRACWWSRTGA